MVTLTTVGGVPMFVACIVMPLRSSSCNSQSRSRLPRSAIVFLLWHDAQRDAQLDLSHMSP